MTACVPAIDTTGGMTPLEAAHLGCGHLGGG
jgi:hypothetical protein